MNDPLDHLDTPATDDPIADGLLFAAAATVVVGATLLGYFTLKESLRRQDGKEMER